MKAQTWQEYIRLAGSYLHHRVGGSAPPEVIRETLLADSHRYRPAYWRRLRLALRHYLADVLDDPVGAAVIEQTSRDTSEPTKPKRRRRHYVAEADHLTLLDEIVRRRDERLMSLVFVVWALGVRPAEVPGMTMVDATRVRVSGAKKTEDGLRGADRVLRMPADVAEEVRCTIEEVVIRPEEISVLQQRLYRVVRALWPARKTGLSCYSYRHALGADLKASGLSREAIAYVMGHQCTSSVEVYGDRRQARGSILLTVSDDVEGQAFRGRVDHRPPPSQQGPKPQPPTSTARGPGP
ncbi:MAG: hypothetical protein ACP5DC_10480 [Halothiobacillaceae bacterium]